MKALVLVASLGSACAMSGPCTLPPGGGACTLIAVPSFTLHLTDENGATLPSATILYSLNGGVLVTAQCGGNCSAASPAFEQVGRFDIQVLSPGRTAVSRTVNVPLDAQGCHPVTQRLTVPVPRDPTVAALDGPWTTTTFLGRTDLRFGSGGKIIGAIVYGQRVGGDGNYYVAFNGRSIRGVAGQPIFAEAAAEPARAGDVFNFFATPQGVPIGFQNALLSADLLSLTGLLAGVPATYTRLAEIPAPLRDP